MLFLKDRMSIDFFYLLLDFHQDTHVVMFIFPIRQQNDVNNTTKKISRIMSYPSVWRLLLKN